MDSADKVTVVTMPDVVAELPIPRPRRRTWEATDLFVPELMAGLAGIAAWEALGRLLDFPFFPPFSEVVSAGIRLAHREVGMHLLASLAALGTGFALALLIGITVGVLMGRFPFVEIALGVYVNALVAAPSLVFVPILFIFFGVSDATRVAVVFLYSVFVITINTTTAVRTVDSTLLEMARSLGATDMQSLRRVILPEALPLIMAGVRLGTGRAVKGMINGEMLIAFVGLGAQLRAYGGAFDAPSVLAIVLIVVVVAIVATALVQMLDRRLTWWAM